MIGLNVSSIDDIDAVDHTNAFHSLVSVKHRSGSSVGNLSSGHDVRDIISRGTFTLGPDIRNISSAGHGITINDSADNLGRHDSSGDIVLIREFRTEVTKSGTENQFSKATALKEIRSN